MAFGSQTPLTPGDPGYEAAQDSIDTEHARICGKCNISHPADECSNQARLSGLCPRSATDAEPGRAVRGLQALRVVLGIDSPETRGWAPVVQQEARRAVDRAISGLHEADRLREHLRLAIDHIAALNGALEDLASLGATIAICGTKYDDKAAREVLRPNAKLTGASANT